MALGIPLAVVGGGGGGGVDSDGVVGVVWLLVWLMSGVEAPIRTKQRGVVERATRNVGIGGLIWTISACVKLT